METFKIGGWVRLLDDYRAAKKGDVLKITRKPSESLVVLEFNGKELGQGLWTGTDHHEAECEWVGMEKPGEKPSVTTLIEEARRRYPIGTLYTPAHMSPNSATCKVYSHDFEKHSDRDRISLGNGNSRENGNIFNENVYHYGKWAEIQKEEPKKEDILAEAKRRYPVGTTFICGKSGGKFTISKEYYWQGGRGDDSEILGQKDGVSGAWVRCGGRWAEIVPKTTHASYPWDEVVSSEEYDDDEDWGYEEEEDIDMMGVERLPSEIIVKRGTKKRKLRLM